MFKDNTIAKELPLQIYLVETEDWQAYLLLFNILSLRYSQQNIKNVKLLCGKGFNVRFNALVRTFMNEEILPQDNGFNFF